MDELTLLRADDFPARLREIPDRPKQLYLRGNLPSSEKKWLCVVGSRAASAYGKQVLHYLIEGLRGYPVVIVSGLAFGIDAEAHRAALDASLDIVAVPGSGLDWNVVYPRAHVSLAREILEAGGALLSEESPEARTMDYMFPKRNRIMVGLSDATLVIEAKEKSGTLITAKLAVEYNRELLVVPGSIFSESSRGAHQFLRLGATPATSPEDVLAALGLAPRGSNRALSTLRDDLSEEERRVCDALFEPLPRDTLIAELGLQASEANVLLSTMELKGLLVEELGRLRMR